MTIVRWYLECSTFGLQNCGSVTVVLQLRVGFFTVGFKEEQGLTETQGIASFFRRRVHWRARERSIV